MKTFGRLTMALAMLIPVAAISAAPAGSAAAAGTSCKLPAGKITIAPGLTTVKKAQTITFNLPVTACVGGGVTAGTSKGSLKTEPTNIATFGVGKPLKVTSTITWKPGGTSTFAATSTTAIKAGVITSKLTGKVTKGTFLGKTVSVTLTVKLGPLVGGAIKNLLVTGKTAFVIK